MVSVNKVGILGGNRIPFARINSAYRHAGNQEMLTAALAGLVQRLSLHGKRPGLVAGGAVIKHPRDFNLTRECVLGTALDPGTVCVELQQACGTSLQAAFVVANEIALGRIDSGVACGVDSASDPPIGVNEQLRRLLLDFNRARSPGEKLQVLGRFRPQHLVPALPGIKEPRTHKSMGEHAEITARVWGVDRRSQDQLALQSHRNLAAAWDRGFFSELVTPFLGLERDNVLRADTSAERLASLAPAFDRSGAGTITAGNASALTDGAAAALLASEDWARDNGHPVQAWLVEHETAAVDFTGQSGDYHEGLLMAPVYAVPRMLQRAGLTLQDFDFYEIHEAFAAQVLRTLKAWEDADYCRTRLNLDAPLGSIDRNKLNVTGSSLSTGHPFAATGARILATLARLLAERGGGRGLISICAAGGQGVCAILER